MIQESSGRELSVAAVILTGKSTVGTLRAVTSVNHPPFHSTLLVWNTSEQPSISDEVLSDVVVRLPGKNLEFLEEETSRRGN